MCENEGTTNHIVRIVQDHKRQALGDRKLLGKIFYIGKKRKKLFRWDLRFRHHRCRRLQHRTKTFCSHQRELFTQMNSRETQHTSRESPISIEKDEVDKKEGEKFRDFGIA